MKNAYFLIADISGYTKLLSDIEIEHATGILDTLFKAMIPEFRSPMAISGYRGDAVFAYSVDTDLASQQFLLDLVEKIYCIFCETRDRIAINSSCGCNGCNEAENLNLKFIIHYGQYLEQDAAGCKELTGPEVIKAFRLLKNSVEERLNTDAYALITEQAQDQMKLDAFFSNVEKVTESYEHLGEVNCVVHLLDEVWRRRRDARRILVEENDPQLIDEVITELPIPTDAAFTLCSRPDLRQKFIAADNMELPGGESARVEQGTVYHCHHGDQLYIFEIVDWRLGDYLTGRYILPMGLSILETSEFSPIGNGTRLHVRIGKVQGGTIAGKMMKPIVSRKLAKIFRDNYQGHTERIRNIAAAYHEAHANDQADAGLATVDLETMVRARFAAT